MENVYILSVSKFATLSIHLNLHKKSCLHTINSIWLNYISLVGYTSTKEHHLYSYVNLVQLMSSSIQSYSSIMPSLQHMLYREFGFIPAIQFSACRTCNMMNRTHLHNIDDVLCRNCCSFLHVHVMFYVKLRMFKDNYKT